MQKKWGFFSPCSEGEFRTMTKEQRNLKSWGEVTEALSGAESKTDRFALFLGFFSEEYFARTGRYPILVGDGAVEIFTQGGYSTGDLDLLCDLDIAGDILKRWEFSAQGNFRGFFRTSDDLYVEILGARDVNDDPEATGRVEAILLGENRQFRIISLEDLIIDRVRACVYWEHAESGIWALVMMKIGMETDEPIDLEYIRRKLSGADDREALDRFEEFLLSLRRPEDGIIPYSEEQET